MTPRDYMRECFRLALKGSGRVSPNPMVGALLVRQGRIVARGYHRQFGAAHAEVDCLRRVSGPLDDATLYVNLEPCSHHGKTPPCADLIISRGVGRVAAAMQDPNPLVAGKGLRKLRRAGIATSVGLLEDEARELNRAFITLITARRPYVHVKIAQSWDGRVTGGKGRWISSRESRRRVHEMRTQHDAVLVGAGTVRVDDPSLTVRLVKGRDPAVVVLDGGFTLSPERKVFRPHGSRRVYLFTTVQAARRNGAKTQLLADRGIEVVALEGSKGRLSLRHVLGQLHQRNVGSVLVEGGAQVFTQCLAEGCVDELTLFVSPDCFGRGLAAVDPEILRARPALKAERIDIGTSGRDSVMNVRFSGRD